MFFGHEFKSFRIFFSSVLMQDKYVEEVFSFFSLPVTRNSTETWRASAIFTAISAGGIEPLIPRLIEHIRGISPEIKVKVFKDLPIVHSKLKLADYIKLPFKILKSHSFLKNEKFDYCFCNSLQQFYYCLLDFQRIGFFMSTKSFQANFWIWDFLFLQKSQQRKLSVFQTM